MPVLLRSFIVPLASYPSSMELAAKSCNAYSKCEYASDCGLASGFWLLWAVSQLGLLAILIYHKPNPEPPTHLNSPRLLGALAVRGRGASN